MSKTDWIQQEIDGLKQAGLYNNIRTIGSPQGAWLVVDGRQVLNFCSNNYLGLANHPRVVQAACEVTQKYGVGPAAVRSIAGTMDLHVELERRLAAFKGVEAAITFQSGFNANIATIPAIVGKEDVIFSDRLNHASIIDGCRLSGAKIIAYEHNDPASLEEQIKANLSQYRRALVVTDGVFSMDGDVAPLKDVVAVAERYGAMVMVDDAHGEGVIGRGGRGIVNAMNLQGRVDIEIGTLSKAFGVVGGYIAGTRRMIDYLVQKARPFLFSSALTAADTAACIAAVAILAGDSVTSGSSQNLNSGRGRIRQKGPVEYLWENTRYFHEKMKGAGFDLGRTQTPITPVMIGDAKVARELSARLLEEGVFAQAIGFPTVPMGKARIRCMVSASHKREDLDLGVEKFTKAGKEMGVI